MSLFIIFLSSIKNTDIYNLDEIFLYLFLVVIVFFKHFH